MKIKEVQDRAIFIPKNFILSNLGVSLQKHHISVDVYIVGAYESIDFANFLEMQRYSLGESYYYDKHSSKNCS